LISRTGVFITHRKLSRSLVLVRGTVLMSPNVPGLIAGVVIAAAVGSAGVTGTAAAATPHPTPVASVGSWTAGDIEDDDRAFWGYDSPEDRKDSDEAAPAKRRYHYYYYDQYDLRVGPVFVGSDRGIDAVGRGYGDDD
jgi:hypothetical protein